jgi:hypothetical protein
MTVDKAFAVDDRASILSGRSLMLRVPWVMWDASRPDPGDQRHGLTGADARAGFKDDASLIFAIAALCNPDRPGAPEAFIL